MSSIYPPILVKRVSSEAKLPERANPTDSGLDVFAYSIEKYFDKDNNSLALPQGFIDIWKNEESSLILKPNERVLIGTGLMATVGPGFEIQVRPRSGLALKKGLTVLNAPGTVDESYRNMIGVILINHSGEDQTIKYKEKIAQLVICPVILSEVKEVTDLSDTIRGLGGFGSTDVKQST